MHPSEVTKEDELSGIWHCGVGFADVFPTRIHL